MGSAEEEEEDAFRALGRSATAAAVYLLCSLGRLRSR